MAKGETANFEQRCFSKVVCHKHKRSHILTPTFGRAYMGNGYVIEREDSNQPRQHKFRIWIVLVLIA